MSIVDNRVIGDVLFADPIGVSSDGADGYTRDWAALRWRLTHSGTTSKATRYTSVRLPSCQYIRCCLLMRYHTGDKLDKPTFLARMFPHFADRNGYGYPEHGLLQLRSVVPESELIKFKHPNANGDPALGVLKNGRTTGTTTRWV
ncbi:hypothetical protein BC826DRAFT_1037648, partial [Russula brevipes]